MERRLQDALAQGATHISTEAGEPVSDEPTHRTANMLRTGCHQVRLRGAPGGGGRRTQRKISDWWAATPARVPSLTAMATAVCAVATSPHANTPGTVVSFAASVR